MSNCIPEEMMVEILKRLQVKTLVRFRYVCKWWKQLIDSPSFIQDHLALQKPRFIGTNHYYVKREFVVVDPQAKIQTQTQTQSLTMPPLFNNPRPILLGTLHGIVCLSGCITLRGGIFLYNPWTHNLLHVPVPKDMECFRDQAPFNSSVPSTYSAFWMDPLTKDFKIIVYKMVYTIREQWEKYGAIYRAQHKIESAQTNDPIYSSSSGDWKELSVGNIADCLLSSGYIAYPAVVMGKFAYWRAFYWTHVDDYGGFNRAVVISFDLEQQSFDLIEGPSGVSYTCPLHHPCLCNWQGSLSLVYRNNLLEKRCEIYSRQQDGSWLNLFRFNLTPNISKVFGMLEERVAVVGEENCQILALTTEDELVTIDTRAGCCVRHLRSGDEPLYHGDMAYDFVQSLLFP